MFVFPFVLFASANQILPVAVVENFVIQQRKI